MKMVTREALLEASRRVIKDAVVENGAIVAANTDMKYYPRDVTSYRYVWLRDASFICVAADILGLDIQADFFQWCMERAEAPDGIFFQRYHTNGARAGEQFQPDQAGTLLWAIWHHYNYRQEQEREQEEAMKDFKELISKVADGICKHWYRNHFLIPTFDLWEERSTYPDIGDNHTYSIAACMCGLRYANELMNGDKNKNRNNSKKWLLCASQMENSLKRAYDPDPSHGYFLRTFGAINDYVVDASLLGLVYPFEVCSAQDERMVNTVRAMERRIVHDGAGVHRYENDVYDGWMVNGDVRRKGAGAWPLLNFWMAIYYKRKGEPGKAKMYHDWVLNRLEKPYIPEQIFTNRLQKSVCPLVWAHAMYVIALNADSV